MNYLTNWAKAKKVFVLAGLVLVFAQIFAGESLAQKRKVAAKSAKKQIATKKAKPITASLQNPNLPKVTQIDEIALRKLLKREEPNAKPLLVNFWATWCDPCREEFPDLVKIDAEYRGEIDFFTISLDFIEEINTGVPKFLSEMKAEMPTYLLTSADENTLISSITKEWSGGLPFTILYNEKGEITYLRQGKVNHETLKGEIEKTLGEKKEAK